MTNSTPLTAEAVRALAVAAQLPLSIEREMQVAAQLGPWLTAANDLNGKMSALEHLKVVPATVFTHPGVQGASE